MASSTELGSAGPLVEPAPMEQWFDRSAIIAAVPPAMLVIGVLSNSTRRGDLGRKAARFQELGIPEIVFVDQKDKCPIVHKQIGDAHHEESIEQGTRLSTALPGFWVDTAWLWQDPLPDDLECLERILAGPSA